MGQQWRQWQYEYLARRNHTSDLRLEPVENDGGRGIATFVSLGSWCFVGLWLCEKGAYGLLGFCILWACATWVAARYAFPGATSGPHFEKGVDSEAAGGGHIPASSWWHHFGPGGTGISLAVAKGRSR